MRPTIGGAAIALVLSASGAAAQTDARRIEPEVTESGEAYQKALGWNGVTSEVAYFDPNAPAPELKTKARVNDDDAMIDPTQDLSFSAWRVIAFVLILAIVLLTIRFGNFSVLSIKGKDESRSSRIAARTARTEDGADEIPALARIRAIADRAEALNLLLAGALRIAADAQGMRLHPSWTVRDALRRIPKSWPFRSALADLAHEAEQVHFGGRDITEDSFKKHLDAMIPVYREAAA